MAAHFKPGGAFPFLGLAANELLDTHVSLQEIWGRSALEIRERVSAERTDAGRIQILQDALLSRLVHRPERHPAVLSALEYLRHFGTIIRALLWESSPEKSDSAIVD